jgi:hypothetical protein
MRPIDRLRAHIAQFEATGRTHMSYDFPGFTPSQYAEADPDLLAEARLIYAQWEQAHAFHHMTMAPGTEYLVWHQQRQRAAYHRLLVARAGMA